MQEPRVDKEIWLHISKLNKHWQLKKKKKKMLMIIWQVFGASLVAQLVKNVPAMRETWVWSLGWEDLLEKGKATHSSILAWRIPWTAWGHKKLDRLSDFHFHLASLKIK